MSKILLIAFKFPPYPGVGGFRWSKLSKYLARNGFQLHVVTVNWDVLGPNTLIEDVTHENIRIHRIPSGYPHNLKFRKFKNRFVAYGIKKILQRIIDPLFYWDDEAQCWQHHLLNYCYRIIRLHDIKVVIATGHPFQAIRHTTLLKARIENIKIISDFRDPWIQNPNYNVNDKKKKIATNWLKSSLEMSDLNVCVTKGLVDEYRPYSPKSKYAVVHNGVDLEVVEALPESSKNVDFIHVGNISNGRDVPCEDFLRLMISIHHDAKILFVGSIPKKLNEFKKHLPNFTTNTNVSHEQSLKLIKNSKYALHFNAKKVPYALSTKIYEHPALGVPTISFNYGGDIEDLINENLWGCSVNINNGNFAEEFKAYIDKPIQNILFNQKYSYQNLSKVYGSHIEKIASK